jgi:hypothetical protein
MHAGMRILRPGVAAAFLLAGALCLALGCRSPVQPEDDDGGVAPPSSSGTATADYIELGRIVRISKFRSGVGHDYSDDHESCRSMKHYFVPGSYPVKIYSPVSGKIIYLTAEWAGTQVGIEAGSRTFIIFHVNVFSSIRVGSAVTAGQQIGTHVGSQTWSDIAVREGGRLLSYFDVMTDAVFQNYRNRGVGAKSDLIITRAARDAAPLACNGDAFVNEGTIPNWVSLN